MVLMHLSKGHGYKDLVVQGIVVQADIGPKRLLSKGAIIREKLGQIEFFLDQLGKP